MEQLKIYSFAECLDVIGLTRKAWARVCSFSAEDCEAAMCREFTWPESFLEHLKGFIVDNGVLIRTYNAFTFPNGMAAFPYQDICTYYAGDAAPRAGRTMRVCAA